MSTWTLVGDDAISLCKHLGHPEVTPMHVAYCLAQTLQAHGLTPEPSCEELVGRLAPPGTSYGVPVMPEALASLLAQVDDGGSAQRALATLLTDAATPHSPPEGASTGRSGVAVATAREVEARERVPATVAPASETIESLLAELDTLVGLTRVKSRVRQLVDLQRVNQARVSAGKEPVSGGLHLVFTGDPGTGKTTVARLVARIYRCLGLLPQGQLVEVGRADLVAGYVGQTAPLVKSVVKRANGGVLFIDEAYSLTSAGREDFAAEAVATLVQEMENHRSTLAVIAAGYTDRMDDFIRSNPGLRSRFQQFIEFDNYTSNELVEIWEHLARSHDIGFDEAVADAVRRHLASIRTDGETGNARYVRGLFEQMYANLATRANADGVIDPAEIESFVAADVPQPGSFGGRGSGRFGFG